MNNKNLAKLPYVGGSTVNVSNELQLVLCNRKETENLRDIWYSAKCRRDELSEKLATANQRVREVQQPVNIWPTRKQTSYITVKDNQPTEGVPFRLKNRRVPVESDVNLQPERYYTPLTRRSTPEPFKFDALMRSYVPVPKLLDSKPPSRMYGMGSLENWKNQVVKVVPARPTFSVPAKTGEVREWAVEVSDDFQVTSKPQFYNASKAPVTRHFFVSPEWMSEKVTHRTGKAYRSNVVFG